MMSGMSMMERAGMGMPGMAGAGMGAPTMGTPGTMAPANWLMVPRCTFKVERCDGGMKITCACDDQTACTMMQNLCAMLAGGLCSCCCMMNGMVIYTCNLSMGLCRCENTKNGVTVTCTSGDKKCAEMIQACCDCMNTMLKAGCTCCLFMNNMPVCCGSA
jgi:hypothetical protein